MSQVSVNPASGPNRPGLSKAAGKVALAWTKPSSTAEIVERAATREVYGKVLDVFDALEPDVYLEKSKVRLREAMRDDDGYWDLCCALASFAELGKPRRYLEIGVRRGRSACVVASAQPDIELFLFDMWAGDYAGVPNPGPEFVRDQLRKVDHRGPSCFVSGRSQQSIPEFFKGPGKDLTFDLITVDGDHRDDGALTDLENVLPRLAVGGVLVFDDICHPGYTGLAETWRRWTGTQKCLKTVENTRDATGTAIALKVQE